MTGNNFKDMLTMNHYDDDDNTSGRSPKGSNLFDETCLYLSSPSHSDNRNFNILS